MAAEAAEGVQHPQAGYFWSQVARLAVRNGDEMTRAQAATKASVLAPELKKSQIEGARERLAAGDQTQRERPRRAATCGVAARSRSARSREAAYLNTA